MKHKKITPIVLGEGRVYPVSVVLPDDSVQVSLYLLPAARLPDIEIFKCIKDEKNMIAQFIVKASAGKAIGNELNNASDKASEIENQKTQLAALRAVKGA